ncbi:cytidine deaminase [Nadsonia fulvescens var. elongata DSM 6958]|uniref:Cytidine deaminase n=1 Tax=Nadsonia fulvescens var. elongata DSM 6958 TaxID=857566 RepID=A0A1E3PE04_9ASCO|nr:cytidine deaminase [Nadsonia fulvescens var. elongata DSM 6958]
MSGTGPLSIKEFNELKKFSLEARNYSYSPYSNFRVGCAVLVEDGSFVQGANVENASYGAGICAERVAITRALMENKNSFKAIGVSSDLDTTCSPCGICRQFIREFSSDVPVYMFTAQGDHELMTLTELLPNSFGPEHLNK